MREKLALATGLVGVLVALSACGGSAASGQQATSQALAESINSTATAAAQSNVSSEENLQTAQAAATIERQSIDITQTARAALAAEEAALTATAAAPILADLPAYGVDPSEGELVWIHPPVEIEIDGYLQSDFVNQYLGTVVHDFVISADITWNNDTSASGCGFVLRTDGNEEALNQYILAITQAGAGSLSFVRQTNGEPFVLRAFNFAGRDPNFGWHNGETNRLTVVGRGNTFSVYTNGVFIEDETDDRFTEGFVAMVALSESGTTRCQFDNAWLWKLN